MKLETKRNTTALCVHAPFIVQLQHIHHIQCMSFIITGALTHLSSSISIKIETCFMIIALCINKSRLISIMFISVQGLQGVSPQGNSPWRTREAGQSSRTGCLPPPLSYTSHSDWDPCRISEIISDTSVSPSLILDGIKCGGTKKNKK